ncbi:MAG: HD domain-containing protein [Christensenellaceae bacterium]|jgi:tRNA nucleotidyltransferase (CCA-adding enzyme)|nr:HD domain-containing protein [Christensenellaceae bacterium]
MDLPPYVALALSALNEAGFSAYVVGGCVRDFLMGMPPRDYDIATAARPEQSTEALKAAGFAVHPTGLQHGTVTAVWRGTPMEVTTFRSEGGYTDHRHPDSVRFEERIEEDLARRDFCCNAIAYHPKIGFIDPFHGREDIKNRRIRCVGEASRRLEEDALRILRALRFSATLGFQIEEETKKAILQRRDELKLIAAERCQAELSRLLLGRHAREILLGYPEVFAVLLPEILPALRFDQRSPHHRLDVFAHSCLALSLAPQKLCLRLALLLHDLAKPLCFALGEDGFGHFYGHGERGAELARQILHRLRFDAKTISRVTALVRWHDRSLPETASGVKRWLGKLGEEGFLDLLLFKRADVLAQSEVGRDEKLARIGACEGQIAAIRETGQCYSLKTLAVSGSDLIRAGFAPGPGLGRMLSSLLDYAIENPDENTKEALLRRAKEQSNG